MRICKPSVKTRPVHVSIIKTSLEKFYLSQLNSFLVEQMVSSIFWRVAWFNNFYVVTILFPCKADCWNLLSAHCNKIMKQQVSGEELNHKKLFTQNYSIFIFIFYHVYCIFAPIAPFLLTAVSTCTRPFDINNSTIPQGSNSILQLKSP